MYAKCENTQARICLHSIGVVDFYLTNHSESDPRCRSFALWTKTLTKPVVNLVPRYQEPLSRCGQVPATKWIHRGHSVSRSSACMTHALKMPARYWPLRVPCHHSSTCEKERV